MINPTFKGSLTRISARISKDIQEVLAFFGNERYKIRRFSSELDSKEIDVYVQEPHEKDIEVQHSAVIKPAVSSSLSCFNEENKGEVEMDCDTPEIGNVSCAVEKSIIVPLSIVRKDNQSGTSHWHIIITPRYPFEPPQVYNLNSISHEEIDASGRLLVSALTTCWSPVLTLSSVIYILELFICGTCNDLNPQEILHLNEPKNCSEFIGSLESTSISNPDENKSKFTGTKLKKKSFFFRKRRFDSMERDDDTQCSTNESPTLKGSGKKIKKTPTPEDDILITNFSKKMVINSKSFNKFEIGF
ncbi:unnamed protein product [Moneuplotes crassus]|uniref:UBC core domain-containing protein n=1 Tax=Euplotes crassus TaxID=5936 RepID=A0AAD1XIH4_EUPCR|nr:unnamed protein product [Moneuplotes crassus]